MVGNKNMDSDLDLGSVVMAMRLKILVIDGMWVDHG